MARRQKSKNDTTKYVIIGIVALAVIFLVMNVAPTGKFGDVPKGFGEEDFSPGEGMIMQEEDGSYLCYTLESKLTESCEVKDLDEDDPEILNSLCSCLPEEKFGPPGEEREEPGYGMPSEGESEGESEGDEGLPEAPVEAGPTASF